jgi:bifunctional DNA-binding transcriptional regulator/antitoxin component of YhaV-PrlF toxin-antitoxin module
LKEDADNKEITKTWITGNSSRTLVIPKRFAKQYGLDKPIHVIVEKQANGLLIRKLEVG